MKQLLDFYINLTLKHCTIHHFDRQLYSKINICSVLYRTSAKILVDKKLKKKYMDGQKQDTTFCI